jgi:hypothetical protein
MAFSEVRYKKAAVAESPIFGKSRPDRAVRNFKKSRAKHDIVRPDGLDPFTERVECRSFY